MPNISKQKIAFILYEWKYVLPETDSALRLINELFNRDFEIHIIYQTNYTKSLVLDGEKHLNAENFLSSCALSESNQTPQFDHIFFMDVPPLLDCTFNFLEQQSNAKIHNSINGLKKGAKKSYTQNFNNHIPFSLVTNRIEIIDHFTKNKEHQWILKPNIGYGGDDIYFINTNEDNWQHSIPDLDNKEWILQEFDETIKNGDTRVLVCKGEVLGAMKRIPKKGSILSNMKQGATAHAYQLNNKELSICKDIAIQLQKDGIEMAALDLIGLKLLEINIYSPGGIARINQLNLLQVEKRMIDLLLS